MSRIHIATRRDFLTRGLGLIGVGATLPNFLVRTALAGPQAVSQERILVVIQLSGGHDGLSAVVPYANDDYARARKTTRIRPDEVIKIDDQFGWHPNLRGFADLLEQGSLAVVQGTGYPNPNRSHFKSMDIWHYANNSGDSSPYGWIGKYCDKAFANDSDPKLAIAIGSGRSPKAIQGRKHAGISFQRPESYRYLGGKAKQLEALHRKLDRQALARGTDHPNLDFIAQTSINANASSDEILRVAKSGDANYPSSKLATSLKTVAALIRGGLGTRVYYVFHGGFDTHRAQRDQHSRLMTELGDAVAAFQNDLSDQKNADRVLTMAFSEFGRRVKENGSQGTDHGKAGPMFLFGPNVNAGFHGTAPGLAAGELDQGDLKHTVDFRSVYASVLENWLLTSSRPVLGSEFPLIDCIAP